MTYEKSRSTWNSGFRGFKDNSPEAIDRRNVQEAERILNGFIRKNKPPFDFARMELLTFGRVVYYVEGDTIYINQKPFKIL